MRIRFLSRFVIVAAIGLSLSSCEDELTSIGAPYFGDTVDVKTITTTLGPGDETLVSFRSYSSTPIDLGGLRYNPTFSATSLFVGSAENGAVESWAVLRFPAINADTLARASGFKLLLKVVPFTHGEATTDVDLNVYVEGARKITNSTLSLTQADLSTNAFATVKSQVPDTARHLLSIPLDSTIRTQLSAASLAFVVTPGSTMKNVRGFAAAELTDAQFRPVLEYTFASDTGARVVRLTPILDYSIIRRTEQPVANTHFIAGGTNDRLHITMNLADTSRIRPNVFATINNAILTLTLDPTRSSVGMNRRDTAGPAIIIRRSPNDIDTSSTLIAFGEQDNTNPNVYRFQLRDMMEYWLRFPAFNFGFDLRGAYVLRNFGVREALTDDYSVNRWTFYGPQAAEADRPKLHITYSTLR